MDSQRLGMRDAMMSLVPPTRDEVVRTIFVGGITEGCGGDRGIERILRTAGNLKRWSRATDADGKQCTFGFAEYDDVDSLETAIEVLRDIKVPIKRQAAKDMKKEGIDKMEEDIEKSTLLVRRAPLVILAVKANAE